MICLRCGKQIDNDSKFCVFCGIEQAKKHKYSGANLEPFAVGCKWGFKDRNTRDVIVEAKYDRIYPFVNRRARAVLNNKLVFVDENGIQLNKRLYESAEDFSEKFAIVKYAGKYSFVNEDGIEISPFKYDQVFNYSNGFARIICDERFSFLNQDGIEITPFFYNDAKDFIEGIAKVKIDYFWGIIDESGKEILPCKYLSIGNFQDRIATIQDKKTNWGIINNKGEIIVPTKFSLQQIRLLGNQEIAVKDRNSWKCINIDGEIKTAPSHNFNNFRKKEARKKIAIPIISIISIIAICLGVEGIINDTGLTRTLLIGKEEVLWRAAIEGTQNNNKDPILKYMKLYPDGRYSKSFKIKLEEIDWKTAFTLGTVESLRNYINSYPDGQYSKKAKEIVCWRDAEDYNTIEGYQKYLKMYPDGDHVKKAKEIISWKNAVIINQLNSYVDYIKNWPGGEYIEEALDEFEKRNGYFCKVISIDFLNTKNKTYSILHENMELTYLTPRIQIISTKNITIPISYKRKDPSGSYAMFKEKTTSTIKERFILKRGFNTIQFGTAFGHEIPGGWDMGFYYYQFYIDDMMYQSQSLTVY